LTPAGLGSPPGPGPARLSSVSLPLLIPARATLAGWAGEYAGWAGARPSSAGCTAWACASSKLLHSSSVPTVVIDDDPGSRLARTLIGWGHPAYRWQPGVSRDPWPKPGWPGPRRSSCAQEDDLPTLETALLTRELRADVRVVVQLSNPARGPALSRIAISVARCGRAVPRRPITEACLHTGVQEIRLATERFAAARTVAHAPATLRELYGALAPVAVLPAGGGDTVICPGRDHRVAAGDGVDAVRDPGRAAHRGG